MKTWIKHSLAAVTALGIGAVMVGPAMAEDAAPILSWEVDLVSDYVFRGTDQFVSAQAFHEKDDSAFNVSPALQPTFTLFGPSGLSLNIWGSFAITDRADDPKKGFTGLSKLDEIDYTLAYDWSNKLGGFTAAIIQYTLIYNTGGAAIEPDYMIKWAMPYAKSVSPYLAYYANPVPGAEYGVLGFSGGETLPWALSFGQKAGGLNDVTGSIGYVMGDLKISGNLAFRPSPQLVGYPGGGADPTTGKALDKGKYVSFDGKAAKDYPPAIFWLTLAYSGSVAAK